MSKRLVAMGLLAAMLLSAGSMAQAEEIKPYDGPEWTFEVPLSELDDKLLVLASPLSPLEDASEPRQLVSVDTFCWTSGVENVALFRKSSRA